MTSSTYHTTSYMDDNKVEGISDRMFAYNWNLRILRIAKNNLRFIEDGAFTQQRNLYKLLDTTEL